MTDVWLTLHQLTSCICVEIAFRSSTDTAAVCRPQDLNVIAAARPPLRTAIRAAGCGYLVATWVTK
jgi:hypothetical protein